jgi:hypothetical protein
MTWLLSRITNNSVVLAYVAMACFVAGVASGAAPAWKYQGARLEAVQARYDSFVAQTKLIGEQAEKEAAARIAADKLNKEKSDAEYTKLSAANADLAKRLHNARSHIGYLPPARAASSHPDRACLARAEFESAIRRLDDGVSGLIAEGDAARIGLDVAKEWVSISR